MIKNKDYDIFCYINKKKQIALTKENQISFLKNFNLPKIKESKNFHNNKNWKFLKITKFYFEFKTKYKFVL